MTDEQGWIEAARTGDGEAWQLLVKAHQQPVFRLAYLLLGDADDAEDVAQETFLRAYAALPRFDSTRPLKPWLMKIATNLCYNWQRSLRRYINVLQKTGKNEAAATEAGQDSEQAMEAQVLWEAIRHLRKDDQQILYLRYFLESSEAETADILQVAHGTVKSRHSRALERLRTVLQKDYPHMVREWSDGI